MNNPNDDRPMPTPFELSKLAIMAGEWTNNIIKTHNEIEKVDPNHTSRSAFDEMIDQAVELAMAVWQKSTTAIQTKRGADQQLKELLNGIFTMPNDEWRERIKDFQGYKGEIALALSRKKFPTEAVKKVLFPDKNNSRETRDKLVMALPKFAVVHKVTDGDGKPPTASRIRVMEDDLRAPEINACAARYFYEVRQIQIASSRRHGKP